MNLLRSVLPFRRALSTLPKDLGGPFPNSYVVRDVEKGWYEWWESSRFFAPSTLDKGTGPYSLLLPPPNVTGSLHLGHALTVTIQDSLCRWHRMRGSPVLWIPGCDHAGIATQVVVEKQLLASKGLSRNDLSREAFLEEVRLWREAKGGTILSQLRRLGASLHWEREYFTLDSQRSAAVEEAFMRLHEKGLIYRGNFLVNFSCCLSSSISDIEVDWVDITGETWLSVPGYEEPVAFGLMYDVAYKLIDGSGEIVVSTTRPETIPGDVAVAVHPQDERYAQYVGCRLQHPLYPSISLPVIADESVNPQMGTGALKITPGHDPTDYEVGKRHGLSILSILDERGCLKVDWDSSGLSGQPRFKARTSVLKSLEASGLLRGVASDHSMKLPRCSRSGDIVEKVIKPQWFVRTKELYKRAKDLLEEPSRLDISPDQFKKIWNRWLSNEVDWCISRQLWWGHRVPMWACTFPDGSQEWVPGRSEEEVRRKMKQSLISCEQDPDVLDTWFSSALLPLSSLGWPDPNAEEDLKRYYPLSLMETGHDILFFWVARMVMLCSELTGDGRPPFNKVLLHGLICDAHGRKMSKSLGNVLDPLHVINGISLSEMISNIELSQKSSHINASEAEKAIKGLEKDFPKGIPHIGTDGLRFGLLSYDVQGEMINLDINLIQTSGAFCNKLWQMTRFLFMAIDRKESQSNSNSMTSDEPLQIEDEWILSCTAEAVIAVNSAFEERNFLAATKALRSFLYGQVCDVYLEIIKTTLSNPSHPEFDTKLLVLERIINTGMLLIHPICPFISEEIYQRVKKRLQTKEESSSIMTQNYPDPAEWSQHLNEPLSSRMGHILSIVSSLRTLRLLNKCSNKDKPRALIIMRDPTSLNDLKHIIETLGRTGELRIESSLDSHEDESSSWPQTTEDSGDIIKLEPNHAAEYKGLLHRRNILQNNEDKYRSLLSGGGGKSKMIKAQRKLESISKEMGVLYARAAQLEKLLNK